MIRLKDVQIVIVHNDHTTVRREMADAGVSSYLFPDDWVDWDDLPEEDVLRQYWGDEIVDEVKAKDGCTVAYLLSCDKKEPAPWVRYDDEYEFKPSERPTRVVDLDSDSDSD